MLKTLVATPPDSSMCNTTGLNTRSHQTPQNPSREAGSCTEILQGYLSLADLSHEPGHTCLLFLGTITDWGDTGAEAQIKKRDKSSWSMNGELAMGESSRHFSLP